jgi:hypothetical protein
MAATASAAPTAPTELDNLLSHPHLGDIEFSEAQRQFRVRTGRDGKTRAVPGLVPALHRSLWPDYQYVRSAAKKKKTGLRRPSDGRLRGEYVHFQLELLANGGLDALIKAMRAKRQFVTNCDLILRDQNGTDVHINPLTIKAGLALREWKWRPVVAELPVYDAQLGIATKTDMLCLDRNNDAVLVEWKCGYDNYWQIGNRPMRGPLARRYSNSPMNQALLQALFTRRIIERSYGVKIKRAFVVHLHMDGVDPHEVPRELQENVELLARFVSAARQKRAPRRR